MRKGGQAAVTALLLQRQCIEVIVYWNLMPPYIEKGGKTHKKN